MIKNDFGEDLVVQSQLGGDVDTFNILIQVKGTVLKSTSEGKFRHRFDTDHLLRWVSHHQPVLVCIYDDSTEFVYSFSPRSLFSIWQLSTTTKKTNTITFGYEAKFDEQTASNFIWNCRVNYYQRTLSEFDEIEREVRYFKPPNYKRRLKSIDRDKTVLIFNFLRSLEVIKDAAFDVEFLRCIDNCSRNFARSNRENDGEALELTDVFVLCIIAQADEKYGGGLPTNLATCCAEFAYRLYAHLHPVYWEEIKSRF